MPKRPFTSEFVGYGDGTKNSVFSSFYLVLERGKTLLYAYFFLLSGEINTINKTHVP